LETLLCCFDRSPRGGGITQSANVSNQTRLPPIETSHPLRPMSGTGVATVRICLRCQCDHFSTLSHNGVYPVSILLLGITPIISFWCSFFRIAFVCYFIPSCTPPSDPTQPLMWQTNAPRISIHRCMDSLTFPSRRRNERSATGTRRHWTASGTPTSRGTAPAVCPPFPSSSVPPLHPNSSD